MRPGHRCDEASWMIVAAVVRRLQTAGAADELERLSHFSDSELALLVRQEIDQYIEGRAA